MTKKKKLIGVRIRKIQVNIFVVSISQSRDCRAKGHSKLDFEVVVV